MKAYDQSQHRSFTTLRFWLDSFSNPKAVEGLAGIRIYDAQLLNSRVEARQESMWRICRPSLCVCV